MSQVSARLVQLCARICACTFLIVTRTYMYILGMRTRIFCLAPAMVDVYVRTSRPYQSTHACIHTHTRGTLRTHACMCTHTRVTFRPESKSDLGSCEMILRARLIRESRTRLAYTVYTRARTRLSACACAGYAYSYAPAQMTERTYIRTYIPRIDPDLYCLALMRSAISV